MYSNVKTKLLLEHLELDESLLEAPDEEIQLVGQSISQHYSFARAMLAICAHDETLEQFKGHLLGLKGAERNAAVVSIANGVLEQFKPTTQ